jgi:PAS domain S-box-containing protein
MRNQNLSESLTALTDADFFLSLLLGNTEEFLILLNSKCRIALFNKTAAVQVRKWIGITVEKGMLIDELSPLFGSALKKGLHLKALEGETSSLEEQHPSKEQQAVYQFTFRPAFSNEGMIQGIIIQAKPLSSESAREQQLRDSTQQYRLLFMNNPLPSYIYDNQTLEILEVNEAAVQHYGYSRDEFLGMSLQELYELPNRELVVQTIRRNEPETLISRWEQVRKDGSRIIVDIHCSQITYNHRSARLSIVQDVTEKVKSEEELRRSNERFAFVARASSEALWEWDAVTNEVFISEGYREILGWQIDPTRQFRDWHEYIHPEDREEAMSSYFQCLDDPQVLKWQHQYRYRKADDTYAVVVDKAFFHRNDAGKAYKVTGAIQDITGQRAVQEELRESNLRFTLASKASSDALYDWDVSTDELYWGEGITSLFGFRRKEVDMDRWKELMHPEDAKRIHHSLYHTLNQTRKKIWKEQYRFRDNYGHYRYVLEKGFIVRDKQGKAIRMIGAMQDITDLKQKEEELLSSHDRYKYVTLATSDIIWDWKIHSNDVVWSDNITKVLGWELPENKMLTTEFSRSKFHPEDAERIITSLSQFLRQKEQNNWHGEFRYMRSNGSYAFISDKGYIIRDEDGNPVRMIGAMQDITERHYQEQILSLERSIFELSANSATPFPQVLDVLLQGIETLFPEAYTSVIMLNDDNTLAYVASPRLPQSFREDLESMDGVPDFQSCLSATDIRQNVIIDNIETAEEHTGLAAMASRHGLRSAWSLPIIHSIGKVLGCFAVFHKEPKAPVQVELHGVERVRNIIRILMENQRSLQELKTTNERFDTVMKATHDLIWDWNLQTNVIYRDPIGLQKVYGVHDNTLIADMMEWMERIHPEDRQRVQKVIGDIMQATDQDLFDVEYRFLRDDGSYSYVYDRGKLLRDEQGTPVRLIGAAQDITERKKLEQMVIHNELERQKAINQATVDTQEQERTEIGKELHDNVNQVLTTTKLYLDLAMSNPELKDELISKSSLNIMNVINEIRQLSRSLMDPSIGDLGLMDSIHDLIDNINLTRQLHVSLFVNYELEPCLAKNQKLTIFRIIQETLNNAIRHARAKSVHIRILEEQDTVKMTITDDGVGFQVDKVKKGAGLKNLQNRVYLIDGTYSIQSAPGEGCEVTIEFPITKK